MFNRESILQNLNTENYYIDTHSLDLFLEDWKIDSIYEDEDGLEFYDDLALEKIKKGISLKAQGYNDEQIIAKLSRMEAKVEDETNKQPVQPMIIPENLEEMSSTEIVAQENTEIEQVPQQKSFTLDVTSQTLQMLAEAVALIEAGGYKKDNEILAKQIQELLEHNKELSERIEQLEGNATRGFWARFFGRNK